MTTGANTTTEDREAPDEPSARLPHWLFRWRMLLGAVVGGLLHLAAAVVEATGAGQR